MHGDKNFINKFPSGDIVEIRNLSNNLRVSNPNGASLGIIQKTHNLNAQPGTLKDFLRSKTKMDIVL